MAGECSSGNADNMDAPRGESATLQFVQYGYLFS